MASNRKIAADIVIIKNNKILLLKRNIKPFKGTWVIPGGHLEGNETLEETAIREAKEETGLDVKIKKLVGIYSDPKRDPRGTIAVTYLCSAKGNLKNNHESTEIKFFELNNLPKEIGFDHIKAIKDAIKIHKTKKS